MDWIDLGSNVYAKLHTCSHRDGPSGALVRFGGEPDDDGYDRDDVCVGAISWCSECSGATWELRSLDPLHVEPSVQTTCHDHAPHHGFIREGVWQEC
jgi:hypothetical protein